VKLANIDGLIWVIIFVVVALVKGFTKLQKPVDEDTVDSDETPPVALPRTPRRQPQPRPVVVPAKRMAATPPRIAAPMGPRSVTAPAGKAGRIDADQIRRFVEQLSGQPTLQPPVAPPPVPSAAHPPPPPLPEPVTDTPETKQTIADAPAPTPPSRATQWAQALRDRQNVRNIVIAAEIIGPPRSESA
jgi:hypothetical protein